MESRLPYPPAEFQRELLRRLDLLDREIRALDSEGAAPSLENSAERLRDMRQELRSRLSGVLASRSWTEARLEIVRLWQRYRHEFELVAAERQRRHAARPGQRERGPRW